MHPDSVTLPPKLLALSSLRDDFPPIDLGIDLHFQGWKRQYLTDLDFSWSSASFFVVTLCVHFSMKCLHLLCFCFTSACKQDSVLLINVYMSLVHLVHYRFLTYTGKDDNLPLWMKMSLRF